VWTKPDRREVENVSDSKLKAASTLSPFDLLLSSFLHAKLPSVREAAHASPPFICLKAYDLFTSKGEETIQCPPRTRICTATFQIKLPWRFF
jgi:hypothetical protein